MIAYKIVSKSRRNRSSFVMVATFAVIAAGSFSLAGCGGGGSASVRPTPQTSSSPSPLPSTSPSASPSPVASPGTGGSNTLASYFNIANNQTTLTYRDVTTVTTPNPVTGQPSANTTTTEYSTVGGNPFATGKTGKRETVPYATAQGEVSVTRQEELDEDSRLIGYTYFTLSADAYKLYGQETLDAQGRTTNRTRYSPAASFALNLHPGESVSQKVHVVETETDFESNSVEQQEYDQTFTLTFVKIESVTVPAGTYTAALANWGFAYDSAAQNDHPPLHVEATVSSWLASATGLVKSTMDSRFRMQLPGSDDGEAQTVETRTQSNTELIAETK